MFLWIFLGSIGVTMLLFILALTLPVILTGKVSGGSDTGLSYHGSILGFGGAAGLAIEPQGEDHRATVLLFGFRTIRFRVTSDGDVPGFIKKKAGKKASEKKKKPAGTFKERISGAVQQFRKYWPKIKQVYRDIWYVVHIDRFIGQVTFGFSDPALTGKLIGIIAAVNRLLPKPFYIEQSFDFTKRVIRGGLDVRVTIRPDRFWRKLITYIPFLISEYRERRTQSGNVTKQVIIQEGV